MKNFIRFLSKSDEKGLTERSRKQKKKLTCSLINLERVSNLHCQRKRLFYRVMLSPSSSSIRGIQYLMSFPRPNFLNFKVI